MKVVSSQQMSYLESLAYRDGASESDFMEEAGSGIALVVHEYVESHKASRPVILACGKGNNAGDGYVAGLHLLNLDYEVLAYQLVPITECSRLCRASYQRFLQAGGRVIQIQTAEELSLPTEGIIVDAIFGTGFHGQVADPFKAIIKKLNASNLPIISVDIPSGLDGSTGQAADAAIIATETAFLGLPKTGFFLNDGWDCVGKLRYVDFGIPHNYIEESDSEMIMLSTDLLTPYLPKLKRSRHKYQAGSVVGFAGSPGMAGAAILSSSAALHGGSGIVYLVHPLGLEQELVSAPYEIIKIPYTGDKTALVSLINKASAMFIGPGIGRKEETNTLLKSLLPEIKIPCVIDGDALTLIGSQDIEFPETTVLTPHRGEMSKLLGEDSVEPLSLEYLQRCKDYATRKNVTLVVKGGPTFIILPAHPILVNPRGDPGMATAGSGDVLTGLITSLLSQKLTPEKAASLGVYVHGIAGEIAALELTSFCMTASDIIFRFTEGFLFEE